MRKIKRKILFGIPMLLILAYIIVSFVFIAKEERGSTLNEIIVKIKNPNLPFVKEEEILNIFRKNVKDTVMLNDSINKNTIELAIAKNPYVEKVQVYQTPTNNYVIEIVQRTPFLRVMTDSTSFYLDREGIKLPTGKKYATKVHLYRGNITEQWARKHLVTFQNMLEENPFWGEMIDYAVIGKQQDISLYLKAKSGEVRLGNMENIPEKLEKLLLFINKVGIYKGLDAYSAIDLRFDNQVVCVKK